MAKLSKAEQAKKEVARNYQREWYRKNKSKKNAKKLESVVAYPEPEPEADPFLDVLTAYATLYNATDDVQIKADVNKLLASILPKL